MIKNRLIAFMFVLFLLLPIAFLGCGGGGSDSPASSPSSPPPSTPSPSIQVLPSSYDFGIVTPDTPDNSPAPLEVEIANNGTAALTVDNITLSDTTNFSLDLSKGSSPCSTASTSILAGKNCTAEIAFNPQSDASFTANLTISSDDPDNPTLNVPLSAIREPISKLNVSINQVEVLCPSQNVTAYVSVTDQGGYTVKGLLPADFQVTESGAGGYADHPTTAPYVEGNATLSVVLVMDYSGSITGVPDAVSDMQDSAVSFVNNLGTYDEAEIIKFATDIAVVQDFTSDKTLLTDAIQNTVDLGTKTKLYDAIVRAVDETAKGSKDRKAVIVMTDGTDGDGSGIQLSTNSLDAAINDAESNGVPIFTVGIGDQIDLAVLQQIADGTGGQFYEATTPDNLRTIYQQLSDVLFKYQYILTYTSTLAAPATTDLTIEATLQQTPPAPPVVGNNTRVIEICP